MIDFRLIPYHGDYRIPKMQLHSLPDVFIRIPDHMGDKKDALRQYRGPYGTHVLEYPQEWSFHRDYADPRYNPMDHLLLDAPEIVIAGLLGLAVAGRIYDQERSLAKSALAGAAAGLVTWSVLSGLRKLTEERGSFQRIPPR